MVDSLIILIYISFDVDNWKFFKIKFINLFDIIMELCGIWLINVDSKIFYFRDKIVEVMNFFVDIGFNVIFFVVWNKVFIFYFS